MLVMQRETDDWVKWPVTQNGAAYTGAWSYQIVAYGARPTGTWLTAVVNGADKGVDIQGLTAGYYSIFVRIDGQGAYVPVLNPKSLIIA